MAIFIITALLTALNHQQKISSFNYNVILETMKGYDIERQINLLDELSEKAEVIIITPINHPNVINKINELTDKVKNYYTKF